MISQLLLVVAGLYLVHIWLNRKSSRLPLPPGPRPKPIIGNLDEMPWQGVPQWHHWLKHKELYGISKTKKVNFRGCVYSRCFAAFIGPISSITVFGQPIIILNDARCAIEILEKRSATYSARPEQPFMEMYV